MVVVKVMTCGATTLGRPLAKYAKQEGDDPKEHLYNRYLRGALKRFVKEVTPPFPTIPKEVHCS